MAQTSVLRDVGRLLKYLLKSQIADLADESSITFNSPAEMEEASKTQLSLFLYQVNENTQLRNSPVWDSIEKKMLDPSVAMDLYYLLTPYALDRETEWVILENIIELFHNELIFTNAGQATGDDLDEIKAIQESLAATGNENLRIVPINIPLDELSRLWERFSSKPYKLAVSYLVTPVRIPTPKYSVPVVKNVTRDVKLK